MKRSEIVNLKGIAGIMNKLLRVFIFSLTVLFSCGFDKHSDTESIKNSAEENNPKAIRDYRLTTDKLLFQKDEKGDLNEMSFDQAIIKFCKREKKEEECLCKAAAFRIAQLCCMFAGDSVFRSFEVEKIRTGWNADGIKGLFVKKLGVPPERFVIDEKATPNDALTLDDSWYEISFKNGEMFALKGTSRIYTEKYLELRNRFKKGDQSVKEDFAEEKRKVKENLSELPFIDKFEIEAISSFKNES